MAFQGLITSFVVSEGNGRNSKSLTPDHSYDCDIL